jgi:hypothetical protein
LRIAYDAALRRYWCCRNGAGTEGEELDGVEGSRYRRGSGISPPSLPTGAGCVGTPPVAQGSGARPRRAQAEAEGKRRRSRPLRLLRSVTPTPTLIASLRFSSAYRIPPLAPTIPAVAMARTRRSGSLGGSGCGGSRPPVARRKAPAAHQRSEVRIERGGAFAGRGPHLRALLNLRVERDLERSAQRAHPRSVQAHFPDSSSRALL